MLTKIAGIGLVVALAAALVAGSAYVLLRSAEAQAGYGPPAHERGHIARQLGDDCRGGDGTGHAHGHGTTGEAGHGHADEAGHGHEACDDDQHPAETWLTVTGTVIALDHDLAIQTADGEMVVHLGPEWYWEAQGITLNAGDQVEVTGFYEGDDFEAGQIENLTTGQAVTLRDEVGHPLWAGHGRWGQ